MEKLIHFSLRNKLIIILFTLTVVGFGLFSLTQIPIGAVPDITNNQVQIITTSRDLSTQDMEQFVTYPLELEMTNLPGVKEIRSISKFGLSVITVVFDDNMGTYLPRQLIAEKLKVAQENIPEGFGQPFMGPISTGLGEIYQYILDVKPGYEDRYSAMELRTIQDWIVKRQLAGIPGVVEVNTWGGFLKQYEVAVNPEKLKAINITIADIFSALENNNSVAGGGYIERTNESYFIRADGLVDSVDDIRNIIVDSRGGIPVYLKDVATVRYGSATRFGAITGNGQGEKVLGQVMMLKDANSKQVIENVKRRVAEIQSSLPEGVYINPFLERSELIGKTTLTIAENLILGCLIVIFVVVLLLGNMRSGLVVASIIPLSLLFALTMMYIFGVDANLMSLGAIDFGIIIDGAVIIVEFISFQISSHAANLSTLPSSEKMREIDDITLNSTTKMMRSAIFGQLIIIIVFIPILALSNVEGKMFRPMALTFSFALIGAMIFCFTYVPVISSLFLKPIKHSKHTISQKLLTFLDRLYLPSIGWALRHRRIILFAAGGLFAITLFTFSRMGGEFVPTLDEGDFVIQPVLKTGTSLSKTIELTSKMEKIIKEFPEVKQVVSRIGAAEVPTDPMSMEESDVIITLKAPDEWVTATTKDGLADKFKEALSIIPGVDYEFTQPIEMRFNELITGVRADLAIKVFGEDLDILQRKAVEIGKLIEDVEGAADISVEKITGLPQMSVSYNRAQLARYGLNIADLNQIISMSFAGTPAGSVFEGEKQFDLVVRYESRFRHDIENIRNTYVPLPGGGRVPLSQLANISIVKGPAKISRDNARRRIVVGVNVRNRDLESVVADVQKLIDKNIKLQPGYTINYGGQFENLRSARERLMIAVPIALLLIFVLLHFAFRSMVDAFMIYSAIPLSAIGGVFLLWIRDLPFSISAGVGFIALFGIAVLNGIVLIEHFKELKEKGINDIRERVIIGTRQRLRPVLLTASAAALGFLPMAVSTSAGAEVQRPLATVVIGGLVTATLLTLVVLPVLYTFFEERKDFGASPRKKILSTGIVMLIFCAGNVQAQPKAITLDEAINLALSNNRAVLASNLEFEARKQAVGSAYALGNTTLYFNKDENNIAPDGSRLDVWGVQQNFPFPTVLYQQKQINQAAIDVTRNEQAITIAEISQHVAQAYETVVYLQNIERQYTELDSVYRRFAVAAEMRKKLGETSYLELITAQAKQKEVELLLRANHSELRSAYLELFAWMQSDTNYTVTENYKVALPLKKEFTFGDNPGVKRYHSLLQLANRTVNLEWNRLLPDITIDFFRGKSLREKESFSGFQIGVSIPVLFLANKSRIQEAKTRRLIAEANLQDYQLRLIAHHKQLREELVKYDRAVHYYQNTGRMLSETLQKTAEYSFREGEIDFFQYILSLDQAIQIEIQFLSDLHQYNQTVIALNYLTY